MRTRSPSRYTLEWPFDQYTIRRKSAMVPHRPCVLHSGFRVNHIIITGPGGFMAKEFTHPSILQSHDTYFSTPQVIEDRELGLHETPLCARRVCSTGMIRKYGAG